jgi:type IV secretory pathway component VirB8
VVGIVAMLPLKETKPFLVRVDNHTGAADILTTLDSKPMSYDEVVDKYWLARYTRARERWDWHTAQDDYDSIRLMSTATVGKDYANLFEGPNAIDKKLGSHTVASVDILSVVPSGNGIATVRFTKKIRAREADERMVQAVPYIATIGYEYQRTTKYKEQDRLINPIGFTVKSFRVDPEIPGTNVHTAQVY